VPAPTVVRANRDTPDVRPTNSIRHDSECIAIRVCYLIAQDEDIIRYEVRPQNPDGRTLDAFKGFIADRLNLWKV
jgi:hypothetical protein